MKAPLSHAMPLIDVVLHIASVDLQHRESNYAKNLEPWPQAIPKSLRVQALIDTGASISSARRGLIEKMGISQRGKCDINGLVSGSKRGLEVTAHPNYPIGLELLTPNGTNPLLRVEILQVVGLDLASARFDAIIGMDILQHCHFHLDGPNKSFELIAPKAYLDEVSSVSRDEAL